MKALTPLPLCLIACVAACGNDAITSAPPPPPAARSAAPAVASAAPSAKAPEFTEADFAENDHNRDPFRSFASLFVDAKQKASKTELPVVLPQYAIDELKLVAIVLSGDYPRAMLLDPTGKGWVVKRGDYIGRPDTVHTGGTNGTDYQINWRIERVRDGDIVLNREDRTMNTRLVTRVIPLHPEPEKEGDREQRL